MKSFKAEELLSKGDRIKTKVLSYVNTNYCV
jgi:hypothetical protein